MPNPDYTSRITPKGLAAFFVLAYAITWILSIFSTEGLLPFIVPPLAVTLSAIFLHYGPAFAAIILVGVTGGWGHIRSLFSRLGIWRVGAGWYLFIFAYPLLLRLATVGIDVVLGGSLPEFLSAADVPGGNPILLLPIVFLVVFFQAGLAEEIGWRGYALPGLQKRFGALASSLILGIIWGIWHFHPLNFADMWPMAFWYMLDIVAFTVIFTWLYNHTQGSILLAALFHTASNVSDWIVPTFSVVAEASSNRPFIIQAILGCVVALVIVARYGAKSLDRVPLIEG